VEGKSDGRSLSMAYAVKRRAGKRCMAKGGEVEPEKLHVADTREPASKMSAAPEIERSKELLSSGPKDGRAETFSTTHGNKFGGYAKGGIVDAILSARQGPPVADSDEELDPEYVPDMEPQLDLSGYHHTDDPEHGNIPAEDDETLVGQILRDRRSRRRE
jgi:hypothetical protein